jgi:hypothetical protein
MILRFEVDQAEAFRQGVNVPKSTNHVEVDPSKLSQEERNLIADRLDGIDVMAKGVDMEVIQGSSREGDTVQFHVKGLKKSTNRVVSKLPTFTSLMEAVREDEAKARNKLDDFRVKFRDGTENPK